MLKRIGKILGAVLLTVVLVLALLLWYVQHNRQKILAAVIAEMRENIRGELTVGNAELNLVKDFSNVVFAEIKLRRMEIASSVLRLFAMGTYTVDGPYDFLIEFPFSNLKIQDTNYTPENIGTDAKTGAGIFISVKGVGAEKPKIALVPNGKKKFKEAM